MRPRLSAVTVPSGISARLQPLAVTRLPRAVIQKASTGTLGSRPSTWSRGFESTVPAAGVKLAFTCGEPAPLVVVRLTLVGSGWTRSGSGQATLLAGGP